MNYSQLFDSTTNLLTKLQNKNGRKLAFNHIAVVCLLHQTPQMGIYSIAEREPASRATYKQERQKIREVLEQGFNIDELHNLCFDLQIDIEILRAANTNNLARELYLYMERHSKLDNLLELVAQERPHRFQLARDIPIVNKKALAIVIDLTKRPIMEDVCRYLEDSAGLDANFLLCQAPNGKRHIDPGNWNNFPKTFFKLIQDELSLGRATEYHIFVSAPGTIAFGLGAMWATVKDATIYHLDKNSYLPAIQISRELQN